ncbi:hypothetical protein NDU88_001246 [Pleurodeles waltl]|uniref:Uncharacterized protein n=1 Tax=Pleurodeles waltl TaxID=8319 RepID=A0AAV7P666_PLEWA|nr:hypothetical protein NDU88_001246 [Pleurodeles waltl]
MGLARLPPRAQIPQPSAHRHLLLLRHRLPPPRPTWTLRASLSRAARPGARALGLRNGARAPAVGRRGAGAHVGRKPLATPAQRGLTGDRPYPVAELYSASVKMNVINVAPGRSERDRPSAVIIALPSPYRAAPTPAGLTALSPKQGLARTGRLATLSLNGPRP